MVMIGLTLIGAASAMERDLTKELGERPPFSSHSSSVAPLREQLRRKWDRVDDLLGRSPALEKGDSRRVMIEAMYALQRELELCMDKLDRMSPLDSGEGIPGDMQEPRSMAPVRPEERLYTRPPCIDPTSDEGLDRTIRDVSSMLAETSPRPRAEELDDLAVAGWFLTLQALIDQYTPGGEAGADQAIIDVAQGLLDQVAQGHSQVGPRLREYAELLREKDHELHGKLETLLSEADPQYP